MMTYFLTLSESIILISVWRLGDIAYGVTIRKKIADVTGRMYSYGTLYSALDQLVSKGYVNKTHGNPTPERGGRSKIYYTLTPEGVTALKEAREIQDAIWDGISGVSLDKKSSR